MRTRVSTRLPTLTATDARRLLLNAQGLLSDPQRPATTNSLRKLIEQMGFVQIDTINVVERAHHLTLFSRMHGYKRESLAKLLEHSRELFEHWTHDASAIPTKWFPHWKHRFERYRTRIRSNAWWKARIGNNPDELIANVLQRIANDGPLQSRDFEHAREENGHVPPEDGWWGWKPQKAALEHLWRTGELTVARRINFQKVYDLTERVLPHCATCSASELDEHVDWACRSALERLVAATPAELAAFWNAIDLSQARQWCARAKNSGDIIEVTVESADGTKPRSSFAPRNFRDLIKRLPAQDEFDHGVRMLSPFDPVLRDRKRTKRLFDFDYTFEAFTPGPKRKYGYYVMPLLEGDRLIGRVDSKFHRDRGELEVKGLWLEPHAKATKARHRAIESAIHQLAKFIGARTVNLKSPQTE